MLPIENMLDYSITGSASEIISLVQLNLTRSLPEAYQEEALASEAEHQKLKEIVERNQDYLGWSEHFKNLYRLVVYAVL